MEVETSACLSMNLMEEWAIATPACSISNGNQFRNCTESIRYSVIFQVKHFNPREQNGTHANFVYKITDYLPTIRLIDGREASGILHYASSDIVIGKKYRSGQIIQ